MSERRLRHTVSQDKAGQSLIGFLAARFPYFDDAGWRLRIGRRQVLVNDQCAEPEQVLKLRDAIEYAAWDVPEPEVATDVSITYRDEALVIVNKPAGLPSHPGGRYYVNTLTSILRERHGVEELVLVNRLDRETSGLVVVAGSKDAAVSLQRQFMRGQIEKRYVVFVEGTFEGTVRAEGYLVADAGSVVRKKRLFIPAAVATPDVAGRAGAQRAVTTFAAVRTVGGISEVSARPETGRLHQIRATLQALGFPVVGDKLYGADPGTFLRFCDGKLTDEDRAKLRIERQALHAASLRLRHPVTGRMMDFEAPLPADLSLLIRHPGPGARYADVV